LAYQYVDSFGNYKIQNFRCPELLFLTVCLKMTLNLRFDVAEARQACPV